MKKLFVALAFSLFINQSLFAQLWDTEVVPITQTTEYQFEPYLERAVDSTLWLQTKEGLFKKVGGVWAEVVTPVSAPGYRFRIDINNTLWLCSFDSVFSLVNGNWNYVQGGFVYGMYKDVNDFVWLLSYDTSYCLTDTSLQPMSLASYFAQGTFDITESNIYVTTTDYNTNGCIVIVYDSVGNLIDTLQLNGIPNDVSLGYQTGTTLSGKLIVAPNSTVYSEPFAYVVDGTTVSYLSTIIPNSNIGLQNKFSIIGEHIYYLHVTGYLGTGYTAELVDYDLVTEIYQTLPIDYIPPYPISGYYETIAVEEEIFVFDFNLDIGQNPFFLIYRPFSTNKIEGKVFLDSNANGNYDSGEPPLPNQILNLSGANFFAASNDTGKYIFYLQDTANTYNLSISQPNSNWQFSTASNYAVTQSFAGETTDSLNFGLVPVGLSHDLTVNLTITPVRPYSGSTLVASITNSGTQVESGQVSITVDNDLVLVDSAFNILPNIGNVYSIAYSNLSPFQTKNIFLKAYPAVILNTGDTVYFSAYIDSTNDSNGSDNYADISKVVTSSFDPNEKTVSPTGFSANNATPAGTKLTYTIYFQNTGTDTAFNIIIRDTIATQFLDMNSFKILASSHPYNLVISGTGNIAFKFNNILLPDSNINEPLSHGFIEYEIKVKDNVPDGSLVKNTAYIYFDFNEAVVTNTTTNLIGEPNAISKITEQSITISPNPTNDFVLLNGMNSIDEVIIYNTLGQQMLEANDLVGNKIDVKALSPGFYFIEVNHRSTTSRSSFVKQ